MLISLLRWRRLTSSLRGLLATAALVHGSAYAALPIDVRDGATVTAKFAIKDTTRFKVDGRRITDVYGRSIRSSENPSGLLVIQFDREKGEFFLQPVPDYPRGLATSIFVVTEQATYTILLTPLDVPADTVILRDRSVSSALISDAGVGLTNIKQPSHLRDVSRLMRAMASDAVPGDVTVTETSTAVPLWQEARYVLTRTYETSGRWVGQFYRLTNISSKPIVLNEREFYTEADIAGIAIEPMELAPGQTASVMLVREARQQ